MSSDEAFLVQVLAALAAAKLEAIVVGNVAAVLQGAPVTTHDVDLLVRDTPLNRRKVAEFAAALGARPREVAPHSDVLRIDTVAAPVDILFDHLPGDLSFESIRSRGQKVALGDQVALVAALADVIKSKEAAGRPKDRAQLPVLRDTLNVLEAASRK